MRAELIREEHLSGAARLEKLCFSEPWSENSLRLLLSDGGVGFVCVYDGEVAAYGGMLCVLDEGQITNIAVDPEYRRQGLGREIVSALIGYAEENGIASISLEVRASNAPAVALYSSLGFEIVGERRNFYRAPIENALVMAWSR